MTKKQKLKAFFKWTASIVILFITTVLVINMDVFDEALLPEVEAMLALKPTAFEANNAYIGLFALSGPIDKEYQQQKIKFKNKLNSKITNTGYDFLTLDEYNELVKSPTGQSTWYKNQPTCSERTENNCFTQIVTHLKSTPIKDADTLKMLDRYQQLIQSEYYQEAIDYSFVGKLPNMSQPMTLNRLYLTHNYLTLPTDQFLPLFATNHKFWRTVLKDSHFLISKMVASAAIRFHYQFITAVINQQILTEQQFIQIERILSPLSSEETSLAHAFYIEHRNSLLNFKLNDLSDDQSSDMSSMAFNLAYQPNASMNLIYLNSTKPSMAMSQLTSKDFFKLMQQISNGAVDKQFDCCIDKTSDYSRFSPSILYNLSGKTFLQYLSGAYHAYNKRFHDLNGMHQLVMLRLELARQNDQNISQIVKQSKYRNTYTDEAFKYDPKNNEILFNCLEETANCALKI